MIARPLLLLAAVAGLAAPLAGPAVAADELPSLDALRMTRERPLFVPGRRGPEPVHIVEAPVVEPDEPPPPEPKSAAPNLVLNGVISGPEMAVAILTDQTTNKSTRLKVGEEHDGWTLAEIGHLSATFRRGEDDAVLEMRRGTPGTGGPASTGFDEMAPPPKALRPGASRLPRRDIRHPVPMADGRRPVMIGGRPVPQPPGPRAPVRAPVPAPEEDLEGGQ